MIPERRQIRQALLALGVALGVGAAVSAGIVWRIARQFEGTATLPAECAVVFGAAVHRGEEPGPGILRRVETAGRLYRSGQVQRLILTGGRGEPGMDSEAAVMRRVALRAGVAPEDIALEEAARSTWENLQLIQPLLADCDSVIGISDRYHLARIRYLASRQGWEDFPTYPSDDRAPVLFELRSILREVAAFWFSLLRIPCLTSRSDCAFSAGR